MHQAGETFGPQCDVGPFLGEVDAVNEQLNDPRLFGWE